MISSGIALYYGNVDINNTPIEPIWVGLIIIIISLTAAVVPYGLSLSRLILWLQ